ncbi:E3 ubiquitin protein ligase DRIP2 [Corylus avellana]|uniref:E3 ubiquitin protein ligase DRIP2 n=1 Tax=Corylus avellana TaxID=13451 RepID=UPI00286A675E|nr:E3 ubiquitin protein ligase DRIP2 [Corylus avellana]XP_059432241.1 E3 ubiquitin protein ligase DRIP2 [Corylus avellana]
MANPVVKVRRETIVACMTCPLCKKLFRDATTISECLHTFCRKCIYNKISDEELECCPICNTDLGCVPLEKLRPDHSLQDVRAKIFPFKRRKVNAPEAVPSTTLPARRKERSLSSLVVSTPRVSTQATMTGRRSRAVSRKASALQGSRFSIEKLIKKEGDSVEDHHESSSSPETSNKFLQNTGQSSSPGEPSHSTSIKETENDVEPWDAKLDLWKPLNCLVEVANRTKSFKSNSQGSDAKLEPMQANESEGRVRKSKIKEVKRKLKVEDEKNITDPVSSETVKPKMLRRVRRKREHVSGESCVSPQAVLDAAGAKHERRLGPVWFSLVASEDQEGSSPLPQIPASYLRIKDGNMPVSFIQKYLMRKLELASEAEVEIKCMGQPVVPTLRLYNLVDLWLKTMATLERVPASIGSSAKDYVMVLAYGRKVSDP